MYECNKSLKSMCIKLTWALFPLISSVDNSSTFKEVTGNYGQFWIHNILSYFDTVCIHTQILITSCMGLYPVELLQSTFVVTFLHTMLQNRLLCSYHKLSTYAVSNVGKTAELLISYCATTPVQVLYYRVPHGTCTVTIKLLCSYSRYKYLSTYSVIKPHATTHRILMCMYIYQISTTIY